MIPEQQPRRNWASEGLQAARQINKLEEFIKTKQVAGIISEQHAQEINTRVMDFYRRNGILGGSDDALFDESQTAELTRVKRMAYGLMKGILLEFNPGLLDEVKSLEASLQVGK